MKNGGVSESRKRLILFCQFIRTTLCSIADTKQDSNEISNLDDTKRDSNEISNLEQIYHGVALQGILHILVPETWKLEEGRFFRPTMKMIYMTMAIYVRVQGIYKVPQVCHRNQRPLRKAIEEARPHFTDAHSNSPAICRHYVNKLLAQFLIDHTYFEYLLENF